MNEIIFSDPSTSLDLSHPAVAPPRDHSEVLFLIFEALGDIRVSMVRLESKVDRLDGRMATLDQRIALAGSQGMDQPVVTPSINCR